MTGLKKQSGKLKNLILINYSKFRYLIALFIRISMKNVLEKKTYCKKVKYRSQRWPFYLHCFRWSYIFISYNVGMGWKDFIDWMVNILIKEISRSTNLEFYLLHANIKLNLFTNVNGVQADMRECRTLKLCILLCYLSSES